MESKAPQVLVIDENTPLSDSDSEDDSDLSPVAASRKDYLIEASVNKDIGESDQACANFRGFKHDESFELDEISPEKKIGGACRVPDISRQIKESR